MEKGTFGSFDFAFDIGRQIVDLDFPGGTEIHMCGVCTSICVLANAVLLRAVHPNARIVIHADACGDVNEEAHRHALDCLNAQQCDIVGESNDNPIYYPNVPYCRDENGEWVPAEPLKAKQD